MTLEWSWSYLDHHLSVSFFDLLPELYSSYLSRQLL